MRSGSHCRGTGDPRTLGFGGELLSARDAQPDDFVSKDSNLHIAWSQLSERSASPASIDLHEITLPRLIEPALAKSVDRVPSGERWLHEIKFNGYRVQAHLRHGHVTVYTRR